MVKAKLCALFLAYYHYSKPDFSLEGSKIKIYTHEETIFNTTKLLPKHKLIRLLRMTTKIVRVLNPTALNTLTASPKKRPLVFS